MSRKNEILGSPGRSGQATRRSPLKPWGKRRTAGLAGLALVAVVSLSACGQKGSLYLPGPAGSAPPPPVLPNK
ncbi:MAG: LPS translocon maturation chaperone LptM [Aquabacterium sp.]